MALKSPRSVGFRTLLTALVVAVSTALLASSAQALTFDTDDSVIKVPTTSECPTLTAPPRAYEAWFNVDDMEVRGFFDPLNQTPWDFSKKIAQVLCGTRAGAQIKIGMFFIRAIGTMTQPGLKSGPDPSGSLGSRPESDPEVIYDALEYLVKERGVKIGLVLDGGGITPGSARALIERRLLSIAKISGIPDTAGGGTRGIEWCKNGCFNTNGSSRFPWAINHEKFVTISDTIWDGAGGSARPAATAKPAVISSSGNWARSQIRNYLQELTVSYGDRELFRQFSMRYDGMTYCAKTGCKSDSGFPDGLSALYKDRGIWVDPKIRGTDSGRGTFITFSPQPSSVIDSYIAAFDNVDCTADKRIRIAMFKLTDTKATTMASSLARLRSRGCDVKMLLTQQGGATTISPTVIRLLNRARISFKCTAVAMHTKLILIGPSTGNNGRALHGTANMSTAGLRYSEEHTITFDARRASDAYKEDLRRVYSTYLAGWYELSQGIEDVPVSRAERNQAAQMINFEASSGTNGYRLRSVVAGLIAAVVLLAGATVAGVALAAAGPKPTVKALGADVVKLSWAAVSGADRYAVRYSTSSTMSGATTVTKVDGKDITKNFTNVSGLSGERTYYFRVIGIDSTGKELNSWGNTSGGARTFYSYVAPTGLSAVNIASTWVELSWQPVSGAPGYKLRYYNSTDKAQYVWGQVEAYTLHGQSKDDKLRRNTPYTFSVAVQQPPIGTPGDPDYTPLITMSRLSRELAITTSNYPLAAPDDLEVSQQRPTSVNVRWDEPTGFEAGMKYRVQYARSANMAGAQWVDSPDNNTTLSGLDENTNYYLRVLVVSAEGNRLSDNSAFQIAKTRVRRGSLTGLVHGPAGPDVEAMIYGTGGDLVAKSEVRSDGTYSAAVRPGNYQVLLSYVGTGNYTSMWASTAASGGAPVRSLASVVTLGSNDAKATAPAVTLAAGARISGLVRNTSRTPLSGVFVTALTAQTADREVEAVAHTPSDGEFTIEGLSEGDHWLRLTKPGYSTVSIWLRVADRRVTKWGFSPSDPHDLGSGQGLTINLRSS